jgi:hypothetical protein
MGHASMTVTKDPYGAPDAERVAEAAELLGQRLARRKGGELASLHGLPRSGGTRRWLGLQPGCRLKHGKPRCRPITFTDPNQVCDPTKPMRCHAAKPATGAHRLRARETRRACP